MRLIVLIGIFALSAFCQQGGGPLTPVTVAPSGACTANVAQLVGPGGSFYTCQSGTWALVSGSGGVASITATAPITTSASTGAITIACPTCVTWANYAVTIANGGSGAITMTTPSTSFTAARTDAGQTFAGTQTYSGLITVGGSTASTLRTITANTSDGGGVGLLITGTASDASSDTANGVAIGMVHNGSGNRQFTLVDSASGTGIRIIGSNVQGWYGGTSASNLTLGDGAHATFTGYRLGVNTGSTPQSALGVSGNTTIGADIITTAAPTNGLLVEGQIQQAIYTAATSGANQSGLGLVLSSNYWNGTVSAPDTWTATNTQGTGTNPTSTLTFAHSGSSGTASVSIPTLGVTTSMTYNVNSPPTNSVVCYKAGGVLGYATNSAGVIGTTCN